MELNKRGKEGPLHFALKRKAIEILKNDGFSENQIVTEKEIEINGLGESLYIDVYAENSNRRVCFEVGFNDPKKLFILKNAGYETRELKYDGMQPVNSNLLIKKDMGLRDLKRYLKAIYTDEIYLVFKDDNFYNFEEYTEETEPKFGLMSSKRKEAWLNFNISDIGDYRELFGELHAGIIAMAADDFGIFITTDDIPALEHLFNISEEDEEQLLKEYSRLPPYYWIRIGYATPAHGTATQGMEKIFTDEIQANKMNLEMWTDIKEQLNENRELSNLCNQYPRIDLLWAESTKKNIRFIIEEIKSIYGLLMKAKPKVEALKEKIMLLENWQEKIEDNESIENSFKKQEWDSDFETFKKAARKAKATPQYASWYKENRRD